MNDIPSIVERENDILSGMELRLENEILRDSGFLINAAPVMGTFHFACPEQWPSELEWFLNKYVRRSRSVLEIGSAMGGMFAHLVTNIEKGGVARTISQPRYYQDEAESMRLSIMQLGAWGYNVGWLNADSTSSQAVAWAEAEGPYDLVFIDGGHTEAVVRSDWKKYGPLATKFVALHDIDNEGDDVIPLWAEIKAEGYVTDEIISHPGIRGIGVVIR